MDFTGTYEVAAPRQVVWDSINDPEILKACIDGCEELNKTSDVDFDGKVKVKVGPVKAKFSGTVTMEDIHPPESTTLRVKGSGGVAGFAKGSAKVTLEELSPTVTKLTYEAKAEVGGKLASVGARLVKGVADKTANQFFSKLSEQIAQPAAEEEAAPAAAEAASAAPASASVAAEAAPEKELAPYTVEPASDKRTEIPLSGTNVTVGMVWAGMGGLAALVVLILLVT